MITFVIIYVFLVIKKKCYSPLMKDVSRHVFKLTATNSRGQSISEDFEVYVQQPSKRVQFEFHLYLDILHRHAFSSDVDWKFKVI